ncbi:MAG: DNA-protecting protein DprA, partial [Clostridia bacterium]|nr:DNA-protecting protein DprA [Clostridia bacterium]
YIDRNSIAIVGCRETSEYGEKTAKYFSYNLTKQNYNIVSGLAKGIDSFAHIGNICAIKEYKNQNSKPSNNKYGKTIAVVGNGLDIVYPKENERLLEEIIKSGGAVISEYPLGTKIKKINFPARNRIISGLCEKTIVVEAKEKSGTLITVDYALEQGRDVYVVPGNINSINSVGTNELIKQGAKIATTFLDVL